MFYWLVWIITRIISFFAFPLKVIGGENIPSKGPFILASNHVSNLDPVVIPISCRRRLSFLAKDTLFSHWLLGSFLRGLDAFPIKRGKADISAIKGVLGRLKQGKPVVVFPEGTRVIDESKRKVQAGVGLIVGKARVPVVPFFIDGTQRVMAKGDKKIKRGLVTVKIGKSFLLPEDISSHEKRALFIMDQISALG